VHKGLPQLLARLDVEKRHGEKDYGEQQHHCVLHSDSPLLIRPGAETAVANGSIEKPDPTFPDRRLHPSWNYACGIQRSVAQIDQPRSILLLVCFEKRKDFLRNS
jgi:hypothetical protein